MTSSEIFLAILGIVGAIIATLVGAWFGAWRTEKITIRLADRQEFKAACRNFRNSFTEARRELEDFTENTPPGTTFELLRKFHIQHKEAMIGFREVLDNKESFTRTWIDFSGEDYKEKGYKKRYYQYNIGELANGKTAKKISGTALKNIDNLLKFANYKVKNPNRKNHV